MFLKRLRISLFDSDKIPSLKRWWNFTFKIICFCGFSYQLQNIMISYFSYGTVTKTQIVTPEAIGIPGLHYCFLLLHDSINTSAIETKYNIKVTNRSSEEVYNLMDHISIGDMFEFAPKDPIESCIIRDETGTRIVYGDSQVCNSFFRTTMYIVQQYICYKTVPIEQKMFPFRAIVSSLLYERLIYEIALKKNFDSSRKVRTLISDWEFPVMESAYAPAFYKEENKSVSLLVSCNNMTTKWLGYPYDKFICQKEDQMEFFRCRDSCIEQKTLSQYGRLPFTSFYDNLSHNQSQHKLVSDGMLQNLSVGKEGNEWYTECESRCPTFPCSYSYCLTNGILGARNTFNSLSTVRVESSTYPTTFMTSYPQVTVLDFIIYVLSSLGTWFGFVIISCDPSNLLQRKRGKKVKQETSESSDGFRIFHSRIFDGRKLLFSTSPSLNFAAIVIDGLLRVNYVNSCMCTCHDINHN